MTAVFVRPQSLTVTSGNISALNPASNLNLDYPGLVWRSNNLTTVYLVIDMGASYSAYNMVALIGSNLRSTDTVRIRTATSEANLTTSPTYDSTAVAAYTGTKDSVISTKTIVDGVNGQRYMRIDITATSHPDGYVEAQRLVIGQKLTTDGIDINAEQSFDDQSVFYSGPGYTSVDEYDVLPTWKIRMSWISDSDWRTYWYAFFTRVGLKKAVLFIPQLEYPAYFQSEAMFGRFSAAGKGQHNNHDNWVVDTQLRALAP